MNTPNLIRMLVIAAALATAGRRWQVPYLQAGVRIVVGLFLLQYARGTSSWHDYLFAALGLVWIGLGASDLWRQWASRRVHEVEDN
jgi:hypothetical protein